MAPRPVLIGHRGAAMVAPENTMAAFTQARALGALGVELDVHRSRDGQLVVHHDYLLDRTTSGNGHVFDHDWARLATLDAGTWFSADFGDERIPLLADVLALDDLDFEVEVKSYGDTMIADLLAVVDEMGVAERVEFTSSNVQLLAEIRRRRPDITTGLFTPKKEPWMTAEVFEHVTVGLARYSSCQIIHVVADALTPSIGTKLQALGKTVHANNVQPTTEMQRVVDSGATRVSADDVALAVAAIEALDPN